MLTEQRKDAIRLARPDMQPITNDDIQQYYEGKGFTSKADAKALQDHQRWIENAKAAVVAWWVIGYVQMRNEGK